LNRTYKFKYVMENERAAPDVSFPKLFKVSRFELEYLKMTAIVRKYTHVHTTKQNRRTQDD
jgi:hypothetical protein